MYVGREKVTTFSANAVFHFDHFLPRLLSRVLRVMSLLPVLHPAPGSLSSAIFE
jgi:hypothetical protein